MEINVQSNSNSDSIESYSINSSADDERDSGQKIQLVTNPNTLRQQKFQSIEEEDDSRIGAENESNQSMAFGNKDAEEEIVEEKPFEDENLEDNSQIEQYTPF